MFAMLHYYYHSKMLKSEIIQQKYDLIKIVAFYWRCYIAK